MIVLAALVLCAATGASGFVAFRVYGRVNESSSLLARTEAVGAERVRVAQARVKFDDAQQLTQTVVEGGTRTVQAVHLGIASIPFGILEAIPPTRPVAKVVRVAHDVISNSVYGTISIANKGLGKLLRGTGEPVAPLVKAPKVLPKPEDPPEDPS